MQYFCNELTDAAEEAAPAAALAVAANTALGFSSNLRLPPIELPAAPLELADAALEDALEKFLNFSKRVKRNIFTMNLPMQLRKQRLLLLLLLQEHS